MKRILLWVVIGVVAATALYYLLEPKKDYRQLALGRWIEPNSQYYATVDENRITFTKGRAKKVIYYDFHVDEDPMTIEVWENADKRKVYRGTINFKNDNKVEARKIPEPGDRGDYFAEMAGKTTFVWERAAGDDSDDR